MLKNSKKGHVTVTKWAKVRAREDEFICSGLQEERGTLVHGERGALERQL